MLSWIADMKVSMTPEKTVHSVTEADDLMSRHNSDKAEIDAREDGILKIRRTGERLVSQGHYAAPEVFSIHCGIVLCMLLQVCQSISVVFCCPALPVRLSVLSLLVCDPAWKPLSLCLCLPVPFARRFLAHCLRSRVLACCCRNSSTVSDP